MTNTWQDVANKCNRTLDEIKHMRDYEDAAPSKCSVIQWKAYLATSDTSELPGKNEYDKSVEDGKISYAEGLTREKLREQLIVNKIKENDLLQRRGKLVTLKECEEALLEQAKACERAIDSLTDICPKDFMQAERAGVRKKASRWAKDIKREIQRLLTQ